jgi:hypothetical protein
MLGTLAKWLRILGYDTEYVRDGDDSKILKKAHAEERILITRDKELSTKCKNSVLVESTELEKQIEKVMESTSIEIDEKNMLSRCTLCNAPVIKINKNKVIKKVPSYAYETHDDFWICTECGRIYWMGTHWENMKQFIKKINSP